MLQLIKQHNDNKDINTHGDKTILDTCKLIPTIKTTNKEENDEKLYIYTPPL